MSAPVPSSDRAGTGTGTPVSPDAPYPVRGTRAASVHPADHGEANAGGMSMARWWRDRRQAAISTVLVDNSDPARELAPSPIGDAALQRRPAGPRHTSEWLSDGVLMIGSDPTGDVAAIAIDLPVEPGVVTVVSLLDSAQGWWWLTDAITYAAPPGAVVRLAVSHAGTPPSPDEPAPAQQLAQRLRVAVIAPDGPVLLVPGGTAFVATPPAARTRSSAPPLDRPSPEPPVRRAAGTGRWLRFEADGSVEPAGPRFPRPAWDRATTRPAGDRMTDLSVVEVPAGLWVSTAAPDRMPPLNDLAFCAPLDPELCSIIVGSAGGARPSADAVVEAIAGLPPAGGGEVLVVPYGSGTRCAAAVARELARRWGRPVPLAHGLPMVSPDGVRRTLATDEDGTPLWWPMTQRMRCGPDGPPVPVEPLGLPPGLPVVAERTHVLREPWLVEVTHFGLWVRHRDAPADAEQLAQIRWDPRWLTVVAGVPGYPSDGIRPVLAELLGRLTDRTRTRVRMVTPELLAGLTGPRRIAKP